jgi:hypothetical protein
MPIGPALPRGVAIRYGIKRKEIAETIAKSLVLSKVVSGVYPLKGLSDDELLIIVAP